MRRIIGISGWVVVVLLCLTGVALAQSDTPAQAEQGQVALMLAPLLAAATAIERIIELIFNWYESVLLNVSAFSGQAKDYLGWARNEIGRLQKELLDAQHDPALVSQIEAQLEVAQERLVEFLESPLYLSRKKTISLILGIVLGLIMAFTVPIKMFDLLNITLPAPWLDMLITGLVIGTGSAPVHSLIGLLQNTKDAVDQARALWSGKAFAQAQAAYAQVVQAAQVQSQVKGVSMGEGELEGAFGAPARAEAISASEPEAGPLAMTEQATRRRIKRLLR